MKCFDVSVIIVSLNSKRVLGDCLVSLKTASWKSLTFELIVIDNGSTDGSLQMLAAEHPDVQVIVNSGNVGYCKAGNQGAAVSRGRYLLFLNDDILIINDALPKLVEFMDGRPEAAMIGSRLLNADRTDQLSSGRAFTTPMNAIFGRKSVLTRRFPNAPWARDYLMSDRVHEAEPYEVDWVSGACMMIRREPFDRVHGHVENFYYFHEQITCADLKKLGYSIYLHPQSKMIHFEGSGSGERTRRVRRLHIQKFHIAAYKWFCLRYQITPYSPFRIAAALLLSCRATLLIVG
jgi:N-acetylglucosaminyl-diphospho-decaprenol L-rhamnosyltransferase